MSVVQEKTDIRERARETLRTVFGYDKFRGYQEEIITHLAEGGDAFVLMPTGSGKSLCYQLPALLRPGVGVVVSPLIALMQDQVDALRQLGVKAAFLNSTLSAEEAREVERQVQTGALDLVYVAPERLLMERTLSLLEHSPVALFAIDEAHCVSQWGHDFRAEYLGLSVLHERFPQIPRIALTATADKVTREEIVMRLALDSARIFVAGFDRPNIRYRVQHKKNTKQQVKHFLQTEHPSDSGIIYCLSRKRTEEMAAWLCEEGWKALPYHAGLSAEVRQRHQSRFQREEGVIIVATIAFGMGIDKPDVRFVAHLDIPKSVEAYYQETGRAGRDGLPADAWMLYGLSDVTLLRQLLAQSEADEVHKRTEQQKLNALLGYCETASCRRQVLLQYFGDTLPEPCGNCDTCLEPVETWDGTLAARKALYCVYQTGQRFGVTHLTDILVGNETERVRQFNHTRLSAFGRGKEIDAKEWPSIFRQLVATGLLTVDIGGHGSLLLTPAGTEVLKEAQSVQLRKDPTPRKERAKRRRTPAAVAEIGTPADQALWDALREMRLELAQQAAVPPYVIFHDSTLREMLLHRPRTLQEMGHLSGVGEHKLQRYGQAFLDVLLAHAGEGPAPKRQSQFAPADLSETVETTVRLFHSGHTPARIAAERIISVSSIYNHLAVAIEDGRLALQNVLDLDEDEIGRIEHAILSLPPEQRQHLRPVYDALDGAYDYGIIRCVLADLVHRFGVAE
ncbi:MAG: DNA helicase RecQ [Armatimonadota bacterium]